MKNILISLSGNCSTNQNLKNIEFTEMEWVQQACLKLYKLTII